MRATITTDLSDPGGWGITDRIEAAGTIGIKSDDGLLIISDGDQILAVYERRHVVSIRLEQDDEPTSAPAEAAHDADKLAKAVGRQRAESMELFANAARNLPQGTGITPFRLLTGEPGALVSHTDRHGTALTLTDVQTRAIADGHARVYTDTNGDLHLSEAL